MFNYGRIKINTKPQSIRTNREIRATTIRLISDGQNVVMPTHVALYQAENKGLDLVEVAPDANPPVCKIIDYGKYQYEQKKKQKANKPNAVDKCKELRFTPVTDDHDIETKVNHIRKFLQQGKHVRVVVRFKKSQMAHAEEGRRVIHKVEAGIKDVGCMEKPKFEGRRLFAKIVPKS